MMIAFAMQETRQRYGVTEVLGQRYSSKAVNRRHRFILGETVQLEGQKWLVTAVGREGFDPVVNVRAA